ncbi:MAG: hypothetical protein CMP49_04840 [Flavobacteriales bacterium]|jgi:uncharacterized membrane protein|nr:hypothetical protein [Flavobacteriales bacterium]|tara:strand:+ start:46936 stop:48177 length:1242 start_codon:yes stop_codon:yes gene_type:complete
MNFLVVFNNDATVLGFLITMLTLIFVLEKSNNKYCKIFFKYVPALLLCYFLPSIFNSLGVISGEKSNLYFIASRYLLPASLVLLTLSIDLKKIINLGPKAIIMFLTGTFGILIGGPLSLLFVTHFFPSMIPINSDDLWRGLSTVAGSWIGGGANQAAMKEMFNVNDTIFSSMITVDVIVANIWMGFLLYGAGINMKMDKWLKADSSAIEALKNKLIKFKSENQKIPNFTDYMIILSIAFGITGFAHACADIIAPYIQDNFSFLSKFSLTSKFFWLIVIATTGGLLLSFTKFRKYEGVGASTIGSIFLYILVATIGMKMNALAILDSPGVFLLGAIWMLIHVLLLLLVAKIIRAPFFFVAVGSQANVGGAASAPVVASAFHPSLAPVGVLLAVLGYALGTYAAWLCGILMQLAS